LWVCGRRLDKPHAEDNEQRKPLFGSQRKERESFFLLFSSISFHSFALPSIPFCVLAFSRSYTNTRRTSKKPSALPTDDPPGGRQGPSFCPKAEQALLWLEGK
jgi:hypothetical protein